MRVVHDDQDGLLVRDDAQRLGKRPGRRVERGTPPQPGEARRRRRSDPGRVEQPRPGDAQHAAPRIAPIPFDRAHRRDHGAVKPGTSRELLGESGLARAPVPLDDRDADTPISTGRPRRHEALELPAPPDQRGAARLGPRGRRAHRFGQAPPPPLTDTIGQGSRLRVRFRAQVPLEPSGERGERR